MKYRADIDGLRAIAVLSVVWFHYSAPLPDWAKLSGGFTGVDVFFVISGFLITQQLYADIQTGRFSLARFYDRRICRILPALLVMLAVVMLIGRWLLLPGDYASLAASTGAAAFGASNFYFLYNTGYFDQTAQLMPLLHTWSLGVEEQFYLAWPILLFVLAKLSTKNRLAVISAAVVLVGFGVMILCVRTYPKASFYMVGQRAWELAGGALLVFLPALARLPGVIAFITGLGLILAGFFVAQADYFPGPSAILPCLGAALVIWPRSAESRLARLLGALSPIGLLSYSLYLWHWPVWVLFRVYANNDLPDIPEASALFILSAALATASYFFVERPFRQRQWRPMVPITSGVAVSATLLVSALFVHNNGGLPSRLSSEASAMNGLDVMWNWNCSSYVDFANKRVCAFGRPWDSSKTKILLWGDSHAEHLAPLLEALASRNDAAVILYPGCPAIIDGTHIKREMPDLPTYSDSCGQSNDAAISALRNQPEINRIVLASAWGWTADKLYNDQSRKPEFDSGKQLIANGLTRLIPQISLPGRTIFLLSDIPRWSKSPVECALRDSGLVRRPCSTEDTTLLRSKFEEDEGWADMYFGRISQARSDIIAISPGTALCATDTCEVRVNGEFIYRDQGHIRRNLKSETNLELAHTLCLDVIFDPQVKTTPRSSRQQAHCFPG